MTKKEQRRYDERLAWCREQLDKLITQWSKLITFSDAEHLSYCPKCAEDKPEWHQKYFKGNLPSYDHMCKKEGNIPYVIWKCPNCGYTFRTKPYDSPGEWPLGDKFTVDGEKQYNFGW